jgi:uncharacterized protein (TIRG00374 family)
MTFLKKQLFLKLIAVIITITLVALLLSQINARDVMDMLVKIKPAYLVIGFVLYAMSYIFRALRFHILLNKEVGIKELFSIVSVHNMALNIFPARSGELSYIYLLKKRHNKNVGEGAATLLMARMLDIISLSILFLISMMFSHDLPEIMIKVLPIVGFFLFLVILALLMFIYFSHGFIERLRGISVYIRLNEMDALKYFFRKMDEMAECFSHIQRGQFIKSAMVSAAIWIILYSVNYTLIIAMGIDLPFETVFLASTFFFMISILPIQGIGGFGTLEGSWAISFMALGVSKEAAISSGFVMHIISIIYLAILFVFGFTILNKEQISDK